MVDYYDVVLGFIAVALGAAAAGRVGPPGVQGVATTLSGVSLTAAGTAGALVATAHALSHPPGGSD